MTLFKGRDTLSFAGII